MREKLIARIALQGIINKICENESEKDHVSEQDKTCNMLLHSHTFLFTLIIQLLRALLQFCVASV